MRAIWIVSALLSCSPSLLADLVIPATGVQLLPAPPANFQLNQLQSNTDVFVWQEQANFVLPTNLSVDTKAPGTFPPNLLTGGVISA